jgi:hypothetical protein
MLFGTSIGQKFHESIVEEGGNDNYEQDDSSDDKKVDFEEEIFSISEPIPYALFQGITSYNMISRGGRYRFQ